MRGTDTELHILQVARKVFFTEGKIDATMQEIADAAQVTRTSLNYYFRSRDSLFKKIHEQSGLEFEARLNDVMTRTLPFREKVDNLVTVLLEQLQRYPYQEIFLISDFHYNPDSMSKVNKHSMQLFLKEIAEHMEKGEVIKMNPVHFMVNIFSLIAYPFLMKPLYKVLFTMTETDYANLLKQRKDVVMKLHFPE
ncbi:TetR/AcrR family transcriptional regulator [Chitinophaga sp.]|uniref:TetR/AcrR family transcriptional regulator n=1 Tax=Chitinophaga sp. TaxID=1869181 RepID=UPI0031DCDFB0